MKCPKAKYRSHEHAISALHTIQYRGEKRKHTPVRAYECDECGFWHITKHSIENYLEYRSEDVDLMYKTLWEKLK